MSAPQRVSIETIVSAYRETGSVWKAAKQLGIVGQSVHERLTAIGYPMAGRKWTSEENAELTALAGELTLAEIAERLGRPYAAVAAKISRLGLSGKSPKRRQPPRGAGYDKVSIERHRKALDVFSGSLKQFCVQQGLSIDNLVSALERDAPDWWQGWRSAHSDLDDRKCTYCERPFTPMTKKQVYCSRKCGADEKRDLEYFNGNRRKTVGLTEGVCQLCGRKKTHGLSSHHVLGKENDPDGEALIALCPGCHQLVGTLANRIFLREPRGWEALISLAYFRANGSTAPYGVHVCVDIEPLTEDEYDSNGAPTTEFAPQPVHNPVEISN